MMKVLNTYHSEWGHTQDGGGVQPREVEVVNLPAHACLVSVRPHANGLIFYLGLACKGSRAKPHCNTRSHRLHGLTSLARYKHTEHHHDTSPAFSLAHTSWVYPQRYFSHRLTQAGVLTMTTNHSLLTTYVLTHLSNTFILLRKNTGIIRFLSFLPPQIYQDTYT